MANHLDDVINFCEYQKEDNECEYEDSLIKKMGLGEGFKVYCFRNVTDLYLLRFGNNCVLKCKGCSGFKPKRGLEKELNFFHSNLRFKKLEYVLEENENYYIMRRSYNIFDAKDLRLNDER